ncbi:MAG: nuclear transport factor 2 family protein [Herpetosiphonaceae bacterium]|nr:nuclear transport factor 2 family protein [Herpetosiphonaceae bacterium]
MSTSSAIPAELDILAIAKRYLQAIERGVTGDTLAEFFTPDVVQEEFPNRLVVHGAQRDLQTILDGALRGQQAVSAQSYEVLHAVVSGNEVALEVQWTGTLAIALGSLPVGGQMRARFAVFIEFRDGKIAKQRNYDCFEPW